MPKPKHEDEDFDHIVTEARSAIDLMVQHKVAPTPERYAVVFVYQGGGNADLSRALNRLLSHDRVTGQALDEMYEQFFAPSTSDSRLRETGKRMDQTVSEMADYIGDASEQVEEYGAALADFSDEAQQLSGGVGTLEAALSSIIKHTQRMNDANRTLEGRLQVSSSEIGHLRQSLEQVQREATIDPLTGIGNRRSFDSSLREAIAAAEKENEPLSLVMIDIDHFKRFNDTYGHQLGDQVLRLVARHMTECIDGEQVAARYGGEEFGVILRGAGIDQAMRTADRIRVHVANKKVMNRRTGEVLGHITLSLGVAEFHDGDTVSTLVHRADEALYRAKASGRNRVEAEAHEDVKA